MLLKCDGIRKSFGGVHALKGVSFELAAGEVHALVGANGAGKSTLSKVIMGHIQPDEAHIELMGRTVEFHGPREAIANGIAMVAQHLSLAPDLTVAENILLPELGRPGKLKPAALRSRAAEVLYTLTDKGTILLDERVGNLSISHCQIVEIAKALALDAKIIIFDEPTTSLTPHEVEKLFEIMTDLVASGKGLVYVSHRLEEIFTISDRATVLRDGSNVGQPTRIQDLDQAELVRRMIGRELGLDVYHRKEPQVHACGQGPKENHGRMPALAVEGLRVPPSVHDVSFCVWPGEILGMAGLVGAGRSETARALFGLERVTAGKVSLAGKPFVPCNPTHAMKNGLVLIPGDRQRQGLIPHFSVQENALLSSMALDKGIFASYGRYAPKLKELLRALGLPESYLESNVLSLSGGMQQKVVISRGLLLGPGILVVDEPTQGVDIGARSEIYTLMRQMASEGIAVLFISSDFEEVLGISDRVVVMTEGKIAANIENLGLDEEKLAMFAAPRSSADSTHRILVQLNRRFGAAAYWVYVDQERVYCFNKFDEGCELETGFGAGQVLPLCRTRISKALGCPDSVWIEEEGAHSLLIPITGKRGQSMGSVGITVQCSAAAVPEVGQVVDVVRTCVLGREADN